MNRHPFLLALALALGLATRYTGDPAAGAIVTEDFSADPFDHGWRVHGDVAPFAWDPAAEALTVNWDSTRPNGFFHRPLGTVLTREDAFRLRFTIRVDRLETSSPDGTFPLTVGLLRRNDAFATNFFRGAGIQPQWGPRNLAEFAYFPASRSISPTFSLVGVATNNLRWSMVNLFPHELVAGESYRIEVGFDPASSRLSLGVARGAETIAAGSALLDARFGDWRLDAVSVNCYNGDHQPAGYGGHVQASGSIDDLELEFPDPPDLSVTVIRSGDHIEVRVPVRTGWVPILERTVDLARWIIPDAERVATPDMWVFIDRGEPGPHGFYRVLLDRP